MKNIKAADGNLYKVPVILIISDAGSSEDVNAIFASFFAAVEQVYGIGWGRKGWQWVYVDEWNTHVDVPNNPFFCAHPVGEVYSRQYDEMLSKEEDKFSLNDRDLLSAINNHHRVQKEIAATLPKSAFPLPYLLEYYPTSQLATNDVPRDKQWQLMAYMLRQLHHKRTWLDAIFVDAVNHDPNQESYEASAIPPILENLPVTVFNSPQHLTELLIKNDVFLGVKKILPTQK